MATLGLKKIECPACNGCIESKVVAEALMADLKLMKCPFCGATIYLEEEESSNQKGYEFEKGRIKAQKEYEAQEARRKEAERKSREQEEARIAAIRAKEEEERQKEQEKINAVWRKKENRKDWIITIVKYAIVIFVALLFAHEMQSFLFGSRSAAQWILPKESWITTLIGLITLLYIFAGPIIGIIYAVKHCDEKTMLIALWLWLWILIWTVIVYAVANHFSIFEAIADILRQL